MKLALIGAPVAASFSGALCSSGFGGIMAKVVSSIGSRLSHRPNFGEYNLCRVMYSPLGL
jgi:hypothetical protein